IAPDTYDDFYFTASHAFTIKVNKKGIYDLTLRQELLKPRYEDTNYHKGFPGIAVKNGGMWRLTELDGESEIISYDKYDEFRLCYNNYYDLPYACVKKNGSWGVVNKYGYEVVPCTYPDIPQFRKNSTAMGFVCGDRASIITEEELALDPKSITLETANSYIISTASGKQLKGPNGSNLCHGLTFDHIYWNSFSREFTVIWNGWQSNVKPNGFELKTIPSQIFDKAYSLDETQYEEKIDLYNQIIEFDPNNAYGCTASALCNIGFIYEENEDDFTALQYYDRGASINNPSSVAATNAKNIRNYYKSRDSQSELEMIGNFFSTIAQTLETASLLNNNQGDESQPSEGAYNKTERSSQPKERKTNHAGATAQNSRGSVNAYNGYVEQLINMNTYHETRYNDSQRRNIQSKMKQLRESNNSNSGHLQISKSHWETWDGNKL
ncbi:MAG: tetratricopeptide repeat protein, partial [Muribaculaceae bacterium]|nr:tetratricopeptide repeat protein [Muribaculaceae bacterium]